MRWAKTAYWWGGTDPRSAPLAASMLSWSPEGRLSSSWPCIWPLSSEKGKVGKAYAIEEKVGLFGGEGELPDAPGDALAKALAHSALQQTDDAASTAGDPLRTPHEAVTRPLATSRLPFDFPPLHS